MEEEEEKEEERQRNGWMKRSYLLLLTDRAVQQWQMCTGKASVGRRKEMKKRKKGHKTGNDVKGFRYGVARECRKTAVAGRMSYTEVFTSLLFFSFSFDTPKKRHISHRGWALVLRRAINRYPRPRKTAGLIYVSSSLFFLLSFFSCCARYTHKRHTRQ